MKVLVLNAEVWRLTSARKSLAVLPNLLKVSVLKWCSSYLIPSFWRESISFRVSWIFVRKVRTLDVHDIVESKLDWTILEEFQKLVNVLGGGINTILFPLFGGRSGQVPQVLPFFRLCFEWIVVLRVNGGGIGDPLGSDGDRDRCVGNNVCPCLGYVRDEAPEDVRINGWRRYVFVSVALVYLCPCCHFLLGCNISWIW